MIYYAHSIEGVSEQDWQLLDSHLENAARLAEEFASHFYAASLGRAVGLLHDVGKATSAFQARLRGAPGKVDHSTAGGQAVMQFYSEFCGYLLAYAIMGHHNGLPDCGSLASLDGSLIKRLAQKLPERPEISDRITTMLKEQPQYPFRDRSGKKPFAVAFLIRMIYSALVDADSLDTELVCSPDKAALRSPKADMETLAAELDNKLRERFSESPKEASKPKQEQILTLRAKILERCTEAAALSTGIYTLSVPTGGGKTFASLSFALNHASLHDGMRRVIYAIPFTSIIEQNAKELRWALGEENVLEHHSNADFKEDENEDNQTLKRMRLSADNWDVPVVVTTNVQFFESLFSNRRSRCRKLHNISGSVIILDEAQMLPTDYLLPCLAALEELVRHYNCTVVLCTATQPALSKYISEDLKPVEIMESPRALYEAFRKVTTHLDGSLTLDELAVRILAEPRALCIVNTRGNATALYDLIKEEGSAFHLSARMTAVHRSEKIEEIRQALNAGENCRVISTQLIEAGVDLDFPVVFRGMAGIDSVVQAAGRCNREGRLADCGQLHIFSLEGQRLMGWFSKTAQLGSEILDCFPDDPLSPDAVEKYFSNLYGLEGRMLDAKGILASLNDSQDARNARFPFATVARQFQLIEDNTETLIIPHDEASKEIAGRLLAGFASRADLRKLGRYSVQIYRQELMELQQTNSVRDVGGSFLLTDLTLYDDKERGLLHVDESSYRTDTLYI